jgi:hypothetical protein
MKGKIRLSSQVSREEWFVNLKTRIDHNLVINGFSKLIFIEDSTRKITHEYVLRFVKELFEDSGWHVDISEDIFGGYRIVVHNSL